MWAAGALIAVAAIVATDASADITVTPYETPVACTLTAALGDQIMLHYVGTIHASSETGTPGEQFASWQDHGKPFPLTLGDNAVAGLDEHLVGLCKGTKATIVIPPTAAGYLSAVVGNPSAKATLNYDVTIVDIQKASGALQREAREEL